MESDAQIMATSNDIFAVHVVLDSAKPRLSQGKGAMSSASLKKLLIPDMICWMEGFDAYQLTVVGKDSNRFLGRLRIKLVEELEAKMGV